MQYFLIKQHPLEADIIRSQAFKIMPAEDEFTLRNQLLQDLTLPWFVSLGDEEFRFDTAEQLLAMYEISQIDLDTYEIVKSLFPESDRHAFGNSLIL
jgi:hypothetical protein